VVVDRAFAARNLMILREAQGALNLAFGAVLSAYVGVSLSEIDNHPFDHHSLARFFIALAGFILCLCVGNSVLLRGEFRLAAIFALFAGIAAWVALHEARSLHFEGAILRILAGSWVAALLVSNTVLTAINYIHHRNVRST
jgi:hypothetical protein